MKRDFRKGIMGLIAPLSIRQWLQPPTAIGRGLDAIRRWSRRRSSAAAPTDPPSEPAAPAPLPEPPIDAKAAPAPAPLLDNAALSATLQGCGNELTGLCARTEGDFLDLGGRLQTIQAEAQQLTGTITAVLSEEQEPSIQGALRDIEQHAAGAIEEIQARRRRLADDLEGLAAIQADLGALEQQNQQFKQVAKNLKMVGLTISIESARSQAASAAFQALAEEITQLARTVHTAVGAIGTDTQAARHALDAVHADIGARMTQLEELMDDARTAVQTALAQVARFMELSMAALDRIGDQSRQIDRQVGQLVVAVQIHDNISQRAAHIQEALDEALEIIATAAQVPLPHSAQQAILGRVYGINRLQMAQLQTITEDLNGVRRQSADALERLQSAVASVTRAEALDTLVIDGACPAAGTRGHHPVTVLTRQLERLIALFDEGRDHLRRLAAAREQTGRTMARMNEHIDQVRDINFEIRLKALNAVIRSSRLGDAGRAIAAIVNEMKDLAEQSNTTIGAVSGIMERIARCAGGMDEKQDDQGAQESAGSRLHQGIAAFSTACTLFKEHSGRSLETGLLLETRIQESRERLGFFDALCGGCRDQMAVLEAVKAQLQPFADAAPDDWQAEEQRIMARYTMDRERQAHLGAAAPPAAAQNSAPTEAMAETAADDFDDNVELF
ncbi:hypothetical protein [Desulfatitalea alkaliphila]|uniref:Methyl-accepting transducer domain-containing protein n=1 Tax=Desulfatitalea alkaliphila TaxID=2929485 RepID=A0AA41R1K8_9BACT|nr:hypothetical protein [Desulfatitalea alkaliphila]MCJ8500364.1 hypothetical protein [Desulfatitalea alkaliphila]